MGDTFPYDIVVMAVLTLPIATLTNKTLGECSLINYREVGEISRRGVDISYALPLSRARGIFWATLALPPI